MMSYLWILLLGSLLAAGANAQDDVADTEEAAASGTPAPEANAEPEVNGEPETDETAEEIPLPGSEAEPEPEPATDAHPAAEDEEPEVAAGGDAEPTPAADAEEEAETPAAAADTEEEAAAPTPEPAAEPEVADPGAEQPTAEGEDATTSETDDATLAPVADGADDEATDPALADTTEAPTDPGVDAGPADPVVPLDKEVEQVEDHIPAVKEELEQPEANPDLGFNLEDALLEDKPSQDKPKSRSAEQPGQAAGATGEADKPEAQVSNSGSVAGILCGLAVALVGAAAGYFTYQKKKLCFKNRQEADPEAARKAEAAEAQADPQVLSTLLNSS